MSIDMSACLASQFDVFWRLMGYARSSDRERPQGGPIMRRILVLAYGLVSYASPFCARAWIWRAQMSQSGAVGSFKRT